MHIFAASGNGMPDSSESRDDFPLLWSPITTICGSVSCVDLQVERTRSRMVSLSLKLVILSIIKVFSF